MVDRDKIEGLIRHPDDFTRRMQELAGLRAPHSPPGSHCSALSAYDRLLWKSSRTIYAVALHGKDDFDEHDN